MYEVQIFITKNPEVFIQRSTGRIKAVSEVINREKFKGIGMVRSRKIN